jgi:cytochrome c peroxidase
MLIIAVIAVLAAWQAVALGERRLESELRGIIAQAKLTGDPSLGRDLPSINDPLAQLGKKLFFTKALGGDKDAACVSCHDPLLGGGDSLALSIGVGAVDPDLLGPGRSHPSGAPNVPRNAPTTFNCAIWDQVMFHDGRLESLDKTPGRNGAGTSGIRTPDTLPGLRDPLAGVDLVTAQSRFPITSPAEMLGYSYATHKPHRTIRAYLSARLGDYGVGRGELAGAAWPAEFARVFGPAASVEAPVTEQKIAAALGAYERSQVFVNTPWRAYVQGDDQAISLAAKRGARLFFREPSAGGAGCASCHSGDFFTDEQFYALAVPQVGPGKRDDPYFDSPDVQADDFGRWYATFDEADRYAFRTPTLLNVEETGPYGHDGAYATLEGIVRHHLNPAEAVQRYDLAQLDPGVQTQRTAELTARALAKLAEDRRLERTTLQDVRLTDRQVQDLIAFLLTLTDPCVKDPACLAPWLPTPGEADPDGQRLVARFETQKANP